MQHLVRMKIQECRAYLTNTFYRLPFWKPTFLVDIIVKRTTLKVFHGVINRVICLENLKDTHDIRMGERSQLLCLAAELIGIYLHLRF